MLGGVALDIKFDRQLMGYRINQCRNDAKLTQEQLAEMIGVTPQHLSNIVNNRTGPSMTTLLRIATALDADLNYLLGANTTAGQRAFDEQISQFFDSLSASDKQVCLALCRAYLDNKPTESKTEDAST